MLRTRPSFGDGSEEVNIREALLNLEAHVAQYCTRHDIVSPQQQQQTDVSLFITIHVKDVQHNIVCVCIGFLNGEPVSHPLVESQEVYTISPSEEKVEFFLIKHLYISNKTGA